MTAAVPGATALAPLDVQTAAADLLESVRLHRSPLRAISEALADLAARTGVDRAVLAIDDTRLGRQVFTSQRLPLGELTGPLFGPVGLITDPPVRIEPDSERLLVLAAATAFSTLHAVHAPGESLTRSSATAELRHRLDSAVAAAVNHGWGFALTIVHCDGPHGLPAHSNSQGFGAADELFVLDDTEFAVFLPATAADQVPERLARFAQLRSLPTLTFGIAMCPADTTDRDGMLRTAAERLAHSLDARSTTTWDAGPQEIAVNPSVPADFDVRSDS